MLSLLRLLLCSRCQADPQHIPPEQLRPRHEFSYIVQGTLGKCHWQWGTQNCGQSPVSYGTSTTRHDRLPPRVIIDATCSTTRVVLPDVESVIVYRPPSSIPSSHLGQELLDLLGHKRHIRRIGPSARCKEVSTSNASILRNATQRNRSDIPAWPHTLSITASSASLSCDTSLTLSSGWCRDARQE